MVAKQLNYPLEFSALQRWCSEGAGSNWGSNKNRNEIKGVRAGLRFLDCDILLMSGLFFDPLSS